MIIDKIQNLKFYEKLVPAIGKVIAFLEEYNTCKKEPGKYVIDGDKLYVSISAYTSSPCSGKIEAHKNYIDLQYVLEGTEEMHVAEISSLKPICSYDTDKDCIFYEGECPTKTVLSSGDFAILFPQDGHIPGVMHQNPEPIKKMVFKIKA